MRSSPVLVFRELFNDRLPCAGDAVAGNRQTTGSGQRFLSFRKMPDRVELKIREWKTLQCRLHTVVRARLPSFITGIDRYARVKDILH